MVLGTQVTDGTVVWACQYRVVAPWTAAQTQAVNASVHPTTGNGYVYRALTTGATGGGEPTWPIIIGGTVVDNAVTWRCRR